MRAGFTALLAICLGIALAFLAMPIIALFTEVPLGDVPACCATRPCATRSR